jgi:hypothetical protein
MHATCTAISLFTFASVIFGEQPKLWCTLYHNQFHLSVMPLPCAQIFSSAPCSRTPVHKSKLIVLYSLLLILLDRQWQKVNGYKWSSAVSAITIFINPFKKN